MADATLPDASRIEAVEFLAFANDSDTRAALVEMLSPASNPPLQTAVATMLAKRRDQTATNIIARWPRLAAQTRTKAIALALNRRDLTVALLQALEQGFIARSELSAADIQRLANHSDGAIRAQAQKIFQRDDSSRSEVVKKFRSALELKGNAAAGHSIYQQRCMACHRTGSEGAAVGPDLASVASGGREKLLTSILDPNAEVAAAFVAYSVETRSGESFVGVLADENPLSVSLKTASGETTRLGRESVASMRATDKSLMPDGLEEGLSAQDMADLLEFVSQAKPAVEAAR